MIGCERVAMCGVLVLISLPVIAGEPAQQTNGESAKSTLQVAPRLKPADIQKLRLPDVRITSAAHYGTKRLGIKVPHVQVNGMIGGTIGFELLLPDKWGPFEPSDLGRVVFVYKDGAIVEYLEYTDLMRWFGAPTPWEPA